MSNLHDIPIRIVGWPWSSSSRSRIATSVQFKLPLDSDLKGRQCILTSFPTGCGH